MIVIALLAACGGNSSSEQKPERERSARVGSDAAPARTVAWLGEALGPGPATLGAMFAGVTIGGAAPADNAPVRAGIAEVARRREAGIELVVEGGAVERVLVYTTAPWTREDAAAMRDAIVKKWGPAADRGDGSSAWLDPSRRTRAIVEIDATGGFSLKWEAFSTVASVLAPDNPDALGVEPYPLIGTNIDKLKTTLGARLTATGDEYAWELPPLGINDDNRSITAAVRVEQGDIVGVFVAGQDDYELPKVRDAMTAKWGKPKDETATLTGYRSRWEPWTKRTGEHYDAEQVWTWSKPTRTIEAYFYDGRMFGVRVRQKK